MDKLNDLANTRFVGDLERRLPSQVRDEWAGHLIDQPKGVRAAPYDLQLPFLIKAKRKMEYLNQPVRSAGEFGDGVRPRSNSSRPTSTARAHVVKGSSRRHESADGTGGSRQGGRRVKDYWKCSACKTNSHMNSFCPRFQRMSVRERRGIARCKRVLPVLRKALSLCLYLHQALWVLRRPTTPLDAV